MVVVDNLLHSLECTTDPVDGTVFVESQAEQFFGGGVNPDGTPRLTAAQQYNQHLLERKAGEKTASDAKVAQVLLIRQLHRPSSLTVDRKHTMMHCRQPYMSSSSKV